MRVIHEIRDIIGSERIQITYSDLFRFIRSSTATKAPTSATNDMVLNGQQIIQL